MPRMGFAGRKHTRMGFASRGNDKAERHGLGGVTGKRGGFSSKGMHQTIKQETQKERYQRLLVAAGRHFIDVTQYPHLHPDRGTPAYHNAYKRKTWLNMRQRFIKQTNWCACCGATFDDLDGDVYHIGMELDHIFPRLMFPWLEAYPDNFQLLCPSCNKPKGNDDATDWRVGMIPLTGRGSFWSRHPDNLARRNNIAAVTVPMTIERALSLQFDANLGRL